MYRILGRIKDIIARIGDFIKKVVNSKNFKRYAPLVIIALVAIVSFVTCVMWQEPEQEPEPVIEITPTPTPEPTSTPTPTPSPTPTPTPEPTPEPGFRNPLTGLAIEEDISSARPLAIVINNKREAMPQLGVSRADIIYEVLVEGEITRMLALFQDVSDIGKIGSIRSARTYFVDIAQSYDAIFIFAGGSPQAYEILRSRNITRCDGVAGPRDEIFYRDPSRSHMSYEHRLVTSGTRITQNFAKYDIRKELAEGYRRALTFTENGAPKGGKQALGFTVKFGQNSKTTSFSFDYDTSLYKLRQYSGAYMDGDNSAQVAVTNVLILTMPTAGIPGDSEGRLNITTKGRGDGYFICGGEYVEIEWTRTSDTEQFSYALKDGAELVLGRGQTYICIIRSSGSVDFE